MILKKLLPLLFTFVHLSAYEAFIKPYELKEVLLNDNLVIIDVASKSLYSMSHIDGSLNVNVNSFKNIFSPYMIMKSAENIQDKIIKLGINEDSHVVIYSRNTDISLQHSTYLALVLITHGIENVSILDGGYMAWVFENELLTSSVSFSAEEDSNLTRSYNENIIVGFDYVKENLSKVKMLDSRNSDEYFGINRSDNTQEIGHIPNASSSYYQDKFLTDGTLRELNELEEFFIKGHELNTTDEVIVYGDNVFTASVNWYILYKHLNFKNAKIYEASLLEWGNYESLPMTRFKWE